MKTLAAVLRERGLPPPYAQSRPLAIEELELDPPGPGEVLVEMGAAGLCHSDLSVINGTRLRGGKGDENILALSAFGTLTVAHPREVQ